MINKVIRGTTRIADTFVCLSFMHVTSAYVLPYLFFPILNPKAHSKYRMDSKPKASNSQLRSVPCSPFPPSALSVGDAEFLSSSKSRVSFTAFFMAIILTHFLQSRKMIFNFSFRNGCNLQIFCYNKSDYYK